MAQVLAAKHTDDARELGFHPNTRAPTNWDHVGHLAKPLTNTYWRNSNLTPGPEQWHVYSTIVTMGRFAVRVAADALGRPIPSAKVWRKGHPGNPDDLQNWVRGPKGHIHTMDSAIAHAHEADYQSRRDRTDPVRIQARRDQRRQERIAELAQRRAVRRERLLAERNARRAVQQAARQAATAPNATETTVAQGIANAMQAVHNLVRPLRPNPDAAAEPNPAPVAAANPAAAPALDLAAAWSLLQEQVPGLIRAQAEQAEQDSRTVTCVVCMDAMPEMAFTECGHAVSCQSCTHRLEGWGSVTGQQRRKCPVCRTSSNVIRIHFG